MKNSFFLRTFVWVPVLLLMAQSLYAKDQGQPTIEPSKAKTNLPQHIKKMLEPNFEVGPRLLKDLPAEAQKILRERLIKQQRRVLPPVPEEQKKQLFKKMNAVSNLSIRDLFNAMTTKKKVTEGITFDEVIESMDIKANELNFKKIGTNLVWKSVSALSGIPTTRVEVMQYCDAVIGRRIFDYNPEFSVLVPCRITVYEDATGDIWLMTLDWKMLWFTNIENLNLQVNKQLLQDVTYIQNTINVIMQAGANGEW